MERIGRRAANSSWQTIPMLVSGAALLMGGCGGDGGGGVGTLSGEHQLGFVNSLDYPVNFNLVNSKTGGFVTSSVTGFFTTAP
jgi:hypothetical protein